MKILSLYCGAGGLDDGVRQALGKSPDLCIDIWKDAIETIKLNHDSETICGKVSDYKNTLGRYDVVVGGPPCQGFSVANTKRSMDPTEINHFWDIVDNIVKPKYYFMENVRGVDKVIPNRESFLVNCADYGIPQKRIRRIYTNLKLPNPTHDKYVTIREALNIPIGSDLTHFHKTGFSGANQIELTKSIDNPSSTVTASDNFKFTNYRVFSKKYDLKKIEDEISRNPVFYKKHKANTLDEPAKTITTPHYRADEGITDGNNYRLFTNEEKAILQGFPNNYNFYGGKISVGKQIGNAVPPPLSKIFFDKISIEREI